MDVHKEEILRIKEVLKKYPRGINVIDIAKQVNMNRQTVTKYLEMLIVSGNVDVKTFGPSKVYYLSRRLPVSSMISLSSDFILLLDKDLNVVNVNDSFLEFTKTNKEDILGKGIDSIPFPMEFDPPIAPNINDALEGKESRIDAYYKKKGKEHFYSIKFIPIAFDDGRPGATVLFEDITERKRAEENQNALIHRLEETNEQLTAILNVTEIAMSTLNIEDLLRSLLSRIIQVMKADASVILLKEGDRVEVRSSIGILEAARPNFSVAVGQGFAGKIVQSGEPQYVEDTSTDTRIIYPPFREAGIRSVLGVPIRSRDEVIGVVHVDWMNVHTYNKQEQDFLQIIADRCGMAIENARLYELCMLQNKK